MNDWNADAIDLQFIREFSVNGTQLTGPISSDQRRERIRVEIWRNKRGVEPFYDSHMTYAEAYYVCYGKPLDLRSMARDQFGRPPMPIKFDEDDDEDGRELAGEA